MDKYAVLAFMPLLLLRIISHIFTKRIYIVAGAKFEPENTKFMDKQRVKSVLVASESPYLIPAVISKSSFYSYLISRQRLARRLQTSLSSLPGCRAAITAPISHTESGGGLGTE